MTHPSRSSFGRPILAIVIFVMLIVGLPMLTPTLNGLRPAGLPLGYAVVTQGIPLLLAVFVLLVRWGGRDDEI